MAASGKLEESRCIKTHIALCYPTLHYFKFVKNPYYLKIMGLQYTAAP